MTLRWSLQLLQEIRHLDHRPRVLLAIDKESVAELGLAFRRRVRGSKAA
jgi:hypothetical protein